jgi:hypothetical protein
MVQAALWQAFTLTFVAEWGDRSQVILEIKKKNKNNFMYSLHILFLIFMYLPHPHLGCRV